MKDWSELPEVPFLAAEEEEELINFDFDFESLIKLSSSSSASADVTDSLGCGFTSPEGIVEEELEWLSNKDAFPAIESCFGILSDNPELILTHRSPDTVLRDSNSNTNSTTLVTSCSGTDGSRVPPNPVRHRSTSRRKPRTDFRAFSVDQSSKSTVENTTQSPETKTTGRSCLHCGSETTPQWRAGPLGPKTLCNACGVRYKSGRLLPEYRPANSPTFSSALHSNSHRKVVEMRKMKQLGEEGGSSGSGSASIYSIYHLSS